ncbi:hypothetical protein [Mangrovibacterium sp.]|uniref:hypothetical protein n=1 Tax=Mangrovibacterium sp. TaxID=1961364 RepID=UPI0035630C72
MKKFAPILFAIFLFPTFTWAQTKLESPSFYSPEFNWKIQIPPGFEEIEPAIWDLKKNATDSIAPAKQPQTILVFKSNDYHYFESNWQLYNKDEQGEFKVHCQSVANQLYQTFEEQIPDAKIDTASSVQTVGSLEFQKFVFKMTLPNGIALYSYMFSHLFDNKEFSANLFYVNEEQGALLMEAWLYSKFE